MQKIIQGWGHRPGEHCASTVLSDLSIFYRLNFSEPFCLGLGAGLGFFYMEGELLSPSRTLMTRSQELEGTFFRSLGVDFEWKKEPDPEAGWEAAKKLIDRDTPALFHADIFYLDHYRSKTHFPLHVIMLWGYDLEKGTAYIADTGWENLIELPLASLSRARYSQDSFFHLHGDYFPGKLPKKIDRIEQRVAQAIRLQAEQLSDPGPDGAGWAGYAGIRKAGERIAEWPDAKDASWCFRWAYQIIERRGTGGGAFRKLYARFLQEAGQEWPELGKVAPFYEMEIISNCWTELAGLLKGLSEQKRPSETDLKKAGRWFSQLADLEQEFFGNALAGLKRIAG